MKSKQPYKSISWVFLRNQNDSADVALEQIEQRRYYEPFITQNKPITLLGLSFKREPKCFDLAYKVKHLKQN